MFGRCASATGIVSFMALAERVMTCERYASAKRVLWVVDNGSSHRAQAAIDQLAARFPNAVMVHAFWLNQGEVFFSVVRRKEVPPNDLTDLTEVERRLADFVEGGLSIASAVNSWAAFPVSSRSAIAWSGSGTATVLGSRPPTQAG